MTEIALPDEQELAEALETDLLQVVNLERNRAWLSLKAYLYARRTLLKDRQVRAIFRKGAEPVDQRAVDYTRGMIDALEWILTLPERTKKESER